MPDTNEKPAPRVAASASSLAAATTRDYGITGDQIDRLSLTTHRIAGLLIVTQTQLEGQPETIALMNALGLAEEAIVALRKEINDLGRAGVR